MVHGRDYGSHPINYYIAHLGLYVLLSRTELAEIDSALYRALIRHHEISLAIPEKEINRSGGRPERPQEITDEIVERHRIDEGCAYRAEKHLPRTRKIIIKCWREHNLPILPPVKPKQTKRSFV